MIAIAKVDSEDKFRKDMFKSKRKNLEEIWNGDYYLDIANIARFAPNGFKVVDSIGDYELL